MCVSVSDKADGYFVNSPLEWGFEVLLGKMFGNKGLEIRYLRYAQSFGDIMFLENSRTRILKCFERENLSTELIKVRVV